MATEYVDCLIVGAGLSGLACALTLHAAGRDFLLVDASDAPGGRVRTDAVDGFLLDRGFQVLLAAYPEARRLLDYDSLHLQPFFSGAYVMAGGRRQLVADPWRHALAAAGTLLSPVATWGDRLRVARLRAEAGASEVPPVQRPVDDISTAEFFMQQGFTDHFRRTFLFPFFRGIFLEHHLQTSARMFHFVFGMMARGETVLPLTGMEAIPRQLASRIPAECLRLGVRCAAWKPGLAMLADGREIRFRQGVLATDAITTAGLMGLPAPDAPRTATCLYFSAPKSPLPRPAICLNGEGQGIVNHIAVPSDVSPRYAPAGASLISVSVVGECGLDEDALIGQVRKELQGWFGAATKDWQYLRSYRIPFAQPNQDAGVFGKQRALRAADGTWLCGDHITDASIDGAMRSGRQVAEAILDA